MSRRSKTKGRKVGFRGLREFVRLSAPEPDVLRVIGEESRRRGTDKLTMREIDKIVAAVRKGNRCANDSM